MASIDSKKLLAIYSEGHARGLKEAADTKERLQAELAAERERGKAEVDEAIKRGYLLGFNASGEGWNGEYPFSDFNQDPTQDDHWVEYRDATIRQKDAGE